MDLHVGDDLPPKAFVAGFYIAKDGVVQDVGQQCQPFVGDHVPEIHRLARAAEKTRAIDNRRPSFLDRLEKLWVFARVVFKVSVLDDNDVAADMPEASDQRRAFALIALMIDNFDDTVFFRLDFLQDFHCAVRRAVVDDDNFVHDIHRQHSINQDFDGADLVVTGDDDRQREFVAVRRFWGWMF